MYSRSEKFKHLRYQLDSLGYNKPFSFESLDLVESLLTDIFAYKEKYARFKEIASDSLKENQNLRNSFDPLKVENERLMCENAMLHNEIARLWDNFDKNTRSLKNFISELENAYSDLEFSNMEQSAKIGVLIEHIQQIQFQNESLLNNEDRNKNPASTNLNALSVEHVLLDTRAENKERKYPHFNTPSVNCYTTDIISQHNFYKPSRDDEKLEKYKLLETIECYRKQIALMDEKIKQLLSQNLRNSTTLTCKCHEYADFEDCNGQLRDNDLRSRFSRTDNAFTASKKLLDVNCSLRKNVAKLEEKPKYANKQNGKLKAANSKQIQENNRFKITDKIVEAETVPARSMRGLSQKQQKTTPQKMSSKSRSPLSCFIGPKEFIQKITCPSCKKVPSDVHSKSIVESKSVAIQTIMDTCSKSTSTDLAVSPVEDNLIILKEQLDKVKAERDYYSKEFHYLEEKLLSTTRNPVEDKLKILEDALDKVKAERDYYSKEFHYLEEQLLSTTRNELQHELHYEKCKNKMSKLKVQDAINSLDTERSTFLHQKHELTTRIKLLENSNDILNNRIQDLTSELLCCQSQFSNLRSVNEHLERSLKNAEASHLKYEHEHNFVVLPKIDLLERENKDLLSKLSTKENEIQSFNEKIMFLVRENDNLMEKLNNKSVESNKLQKENEKQYCLINQLEEQISQLHCQTVRNRNKENNLEKEIVNLKKDLEFCKDSNSKLGAENSTLQSDLYSLIKDNELIMVENENYRKDIMKLKEQVQNYVEEVRRVEQVLEAKENDREEMLEQFKALNAEAMHLGNSNQTLESEKEWTSNNLRITQEKLEDLQSRIETKDLLVSDLEDQIMKLRNEICTLKSDLSSAEQENLILKHESEKYVETINSLESQKHQLDSEVHSLQHQITQILAEIQESQAAKTKLETQIEAQTDIISTLDSAISSSRKEVIDKSLQNFLTQQKFEELQSTVRELKEKLTCVSDELLMFKETCNEYKNENILLKRKITNERFEKVKIEEARCSSTSL